MEHKIISSSLSDLRKISLCHKQAFPKTLFSAMGTRYLMKMFEWYVTSGHTILFHIEENGICIGYLGGMINDGTLNMGSVSSILQYTFKDALISIFLKPWLLFHPALKNSYSLIVRNIKTKFGFNRTSAISSRLNTTEYPKFGLIVIGVDSKYQGKGAGSELLKRIEIISKEKGIKSMYLSVVANNSQAIHTYEKNGWEKYHGGHNLVMKKKINNT